MTLEKANYKIPPEDQEKIVNLKKILESKTGMSIPYIQVIRYSIEQTLRAESKGAEA